jgi:hypothetical protein
MPTKGNDRKVIRFAPELLDVIKAELDRRGQKGEKPDFARWVRQACIDKLKHAARSRGASTAELAELDAMPTTGLHTGVAATQRAEGEDVQLLL